MDMIVGLILVIVVIVSDKKFKRLDSELKEASVEPIDQREVMHISSKMGWASGLSFVSSFGISMWMVLQALYVAESTEGMLFYFACSFVWALLGFGRLSLYNLACWSNKMAIEAIEQGR